MKHTKFDYLATWLCKNLVLRCVLFSVLVKKESNKRRMEDICGDKNGGLKEG